MKRLAIIDHANHGLYIEDVDEELLEREYNGEEERYIEDCYTFDGDYSWDWITDATYITDEGDAVELDVVSNGVDFKLTKV